VVVVHNRNRGNYGGTASFFGLQAGYARFTTTSAFVMVHEVNHSVDAIFDMGGQPRYDFNHGLWFVGPVIKGLDGSVNGEIIRKLSAANILGLRAPWGVLTPFPDADGDGVSSSTTLPVNEATLGTNPSLADADGDGLTDLQELERGIFRGTSATLADTDGDALTQGNDVRDRNPLLSMNAYVASGTPTIDGTFNAAENWTLVMDGVNYHNPLDAHSLSNPNDTQEHLNTKVWSAWNSTGVYFAIEFTDRAAKLDKLHFRTDLNDRGWYDGLDKHYLQFDDGAMVSNKLHAITQDISSIVGNGEWAEVMDDAPEWTDPMEMWLAPLFVKSQLEIQFTSLGNERYYVEFKIPAGARRQFQPAAGKPINFMVSHETTGGSFDTLMELDTGARLLLVDRVDTDGDGKWDAQEVDIGTNPLIAD